jgi:hypothetical protein
MTPAPHRSVELFPIRFDHRIDHLTTQQALPAEDAECRASRILQPNGHHQTMTTKAVHELTPWLAKARSFGTAYRHLQPRRSNGRRPGAARSPHRPLIQARRRSCCAKAMNSALTSECGVGAAETEKSVTPGRIRKRKRWDSQRSFTPDNITLGAMSTRVNQYNAGVDGSTIQACYDARWNGQGA